MSMEDAFLAAIVENPDDDTPRLVYADWLGEHGQPQRAEYIRVQCQLARLDPGVAHLRDYAVWVGNSHRGQDHYDFLDWLCNLAEQGQEEPLRQELRERERALFAEFGETWTDDLRAAGPNTREWAFSRGMLEEITLRPEDLLAHADALFRQFPVRKVTLLGMDSGHACRTALALPHLARLRNLEVWYVNEAVPGGLGNALASAPALTSLSRLAVAEAREHFSDADSAALANAPQFSTLRRLQLTGTGIGPEGTRALAASPNLRQLDFLSLAKNPIRPEGAAALADSAILSRLSFLDLWFTELHGGTHTLARSPHLSQLRTLLLDQNELGPDAVVALASSPFLGQISALDLADNWCGLEGLRPLAESPLLSQLQALDLAWAVFEEGDEVAELLAASPGAAGLRILGMSGNDMSDRGAQALASSPYLGNLWRLALHSNHFTEVGQGALTARFGDRWRLSWAG